MSLTAQDAKKFAEHHTLFTNDTEASLSPRNTQETWAGGWISPEGVFYKTGDHFHFVGKKIQIFFGVQDLI